VGAAGVDGLALGPMVYGACCDGNLLLAGSSLHVVECKSEMARAKKGGSLGLSVELDGWWGYRRI